MFDRAREPNHLFETAVSNLELVVRNAFAASGVAARSADAQQITVDNDIDVGGFYPGEIDLNNPAILAAIDVCGRAPQAPRWPPVAIITNHPKITVKRLAGHKNSSVSKGRGIQPGVWLLRL